MTQQKKKKKSPRFPKFFIVMFPDGGQMLIKSQKSWSGLIPYAKYLKDEYDDNTVLIAIRGWEALKFIIKGYVFNVDK